MAGQDFGNSPQVLARAVCDRRRWLTYPTPIAAWTADAALMTHGESKERSTDQTMQPPPDIASAVWQRTPTTAQYPLTHCLLYRWDQTIEILMIANEIDSLYQPSSDRLAARIHNRHGCDRAPVA